MTKCKLEILPKAWDDLDKIHHWYLYQFSQASATKVINGILDTIEMLEEFPYLGSNTPDDILNQRGYKMILSGRFAAVYRKIEDVVYVYHVADTRTQYTNLFK